jgi:hypothetical protein
MEENAIFECHSRELERAVLADRISHRLIRVKDILGVYPRQREALEVAVDP